MAVNVDTVYQKVLAIANKEQRGYITPQEFNLFANQAQLDIFEQYFYDLDFAFRAPGNQTNHGDRTSLVEEKLQVFETSHGPVLINAYVGAGTGGINKVVPANFYRINRIELNNINCEILSTSDFNEARWTPLTEPTPTRPIANVRSGIIRVLSGPQNPVTPTGIIFYRKPEDVQWGYVVVNEKALYNATTSTNFEVHPGEETNLVVKILALAGIMMKDTHVYQVAAGEENKTIQLEKQ